MAPQQIGQFAILAELAQSAGGVVYKANDPKGKTVALRIVRLDAPGAAEIVPGFRAAAKAASGLSSPNVAAIFGGGETEGVFFVAVEFVEGVKLSSTLAKGQTMSMSEVLDLCRQVCTGLDHAHSKGILHPELKPSNIIVEWDGTAKIMDFGVPRQHPAGEMSEAAYYLSPEEVRGEALSPRSNLFSWAAVLYQMVSGHRPFNASDAETLRRKIVEDMPVAPHELDPDIHPRVSEILLKALAKTPEERYGSGAELLNDLENYKRVEAASPKPTAPPKAAGTQIWSPGEGGFPATTTPKKAPAPPPAPAVAPTPRPAPAPATQASAAPAPKSPAAEARPPAKAPVAAAPKAGRPAAAAATPAAKGAPRNPLFYAAAGGIALLLIVIIAGAYWLRRSPANPGAEPTAALPATGAVSLPAPSAAPALEPAPAPAPSPGGAKAARSKRAAAAPVAAPPATGGLSLDSSPQGAEVQIDGRHEAAWVTPFTATGLSVGSHTITFSKPGHTAASRTTQVAAGQNAVLAVQLAELAAILSVNSEPAGAAITLDGKDTGKLTPAQLVVAKGSHTVAVHKQGYLDASATLQTAPGQTAQFSPALKLTGSTENIKTVGKFGGIFGGVQENQGRVSVRTNPKGAQVQVNGQPIKKTTPVDFYLNPGSYELSVTLEGYAPVKKIIEVQKGQKLAVEETLSR